MWTRVGAVERERSAGTGHLLDEIGEPVGGVGAAEAAGGLPHRREPRRVGEQRRELRVEAGGVALGVGDEERRPGVDERRGVARLVVAGRARAAGRAPTAPRTTVSSATVLAPARATTTATRSSSPATSSS